MAKIITDLIKGAWSNISPYTIGDFVTYLGSTYICIVNNTDQVPTNTAYWVLFAQKGDVGNTGATGPQGPQGSGATVDTDTTLAANLDTNVASQKATKSYVASQIAAQTDGWISSPDTFVYVSTNSFKIVGANRTAIYTKGTLIKFTNNGITYYGAIVLSNFSTDTTITLAPNADFTINNSAITNPFYSYQVNPQGYPRVFNFIPTFSSQGGAFTNNPTVNTAIFSIIGNKVEYWIDYTYNAASGGSGYTTITGFPGTPIFQYANAFIASVTTGIQGNGNLSTNGTLFCHKYDTTTLISNGAEYSVHGSYLI